VESKSGRIRIVKHWRILVVVVIFVVAPAISSFAQSSSSSGDSVGGVIVFVGLVLGLATVVVLIASKISKPKSQERVKQLSAEAMAFLDNVKAGRFTPPDTPLMLAADEIALLHEPSKLIEARATRVYAGGGTRVYGVYIGGGQSSSVQALKQLDSGALTLTTKRLVFTGSMESRVTNLKDIVSIEGFADAIEISTAKRAKRQVYLVRNPILWRGLVRVVSGGGATIRFNCPRCGETVTPEQRNCPKCNEQLSLPRSFQDALRKKAECGGGFEPLPQPEADASTDIRFNCPACGQHLCVEEEGAGATVNCPNCNEQIEIPQGSTRPPPLPQSTS
jgi:hypothetical protein